MLGMKNIALETLPPNTFSLRKNAVINASILVNIIVMIPNISVKIIAC
jgi:hypothetical protein